MFAVRGVGVRGRESRNAAAVTDLTASELAFPISVRVVRDVRGSRDMEAPAEAVKDAKGANPGTVGKGAKSANAASPGDVGTLGTLGNVDRLRLEDWPAGSEGDGGRAA
jgi:hypothetical protein